MAKPDLRARVNDFVDWLFDDYRTPPPRGPKIINDAIHGNQHFRAHEIALIDSPLLQRLKRIRQTGLVYQVFPTARHSRFEHSLGVATVAERVFIAIQRRAELEGDDNVIKFMTDADLVHLRLAALLHDVGHGLCSHAAEQIYTTYLDMHEFDEFEKDPGEVFSHLMITSERFKEWFAGTVAPLLPEVEKDGQKKRMTVDLDEVGQLIFGNHPTPQKYFIGQIVSSPYDADKLDYIARDSFFCGLSLTVDLPRFYSMIATAIQGSKRVLVLRNYVPLEQILFSKMTLFGSVYQHQKVKCLDHMLRATLRHTMDHSKESRLTIRKRTLDFADPLDFLYVTDEEYLNQMDPQGDAVVKEMLRRFRTRDLFVRCLEISRHTVSNWGDAGAQILVDLVEDVPGLIKTEDRIYDSLVDTERAELQRTDVILSVPNPPSLATKFAYVQTGHNDDVQQIKDFFPVENWTSAYRDNKWRCFVYGPREHAHAIRDAALHVLQGDFKLDIQVGKSDRACHLA